MVLGSSLPDRNSKKETVTDYISVVTAVGQPPTANRTPSAVTANPTCSADPDDRPVNLLLELSRLSTHIALLPTVKRRRPLPACSSLKRSVKVPFTADAKLSGFGVTVTNSTITMPDPYRYHTRTLCFSDPVQDECTAQPMVLALFGS